ncbi:Nucleoporin nup85 [Halocaridina rubra]|uniref:Nuclear pore complex protein Nup85 n=1 Tax=Halocaridina rubra TaxID=373956 RepID=A0AAN8WWC2_HALRR
MEGDSKHSAKTWSIPDPTLASGMCGTYSGINTLMVFPNRPVHHNDEPHTSMLTTAKLYQIESFSWLWGRHMRKLVNEAVGTFIGLQKAVVDVETDNCKLILVKKSREYRSMIQACYSEISEQLQSMKEKGQTSDEEKELIECSGLLSKMELILSLFEIVFIETKPGSIVLSHLISWIHQHFPECLDRKREAMESEHPHQHPVYWEAVYGLVLQGRTEDVRQMLASHPNAGTDAFLSIDELLRKMPVYQVYAGVSEPEFTVRWYHWQSECERRLQEGHFTAYHHLTILCQILCGDQSTITSLRDLMDTWYHFMVSTLLFTNPTIKFFRLHAAAQDAISAMRGEDMTTSLDHVLLAAMEADALQVIKKCQHVLDNNWFTAHITDLLYHTLSLRNEQNSLAKLRESLLLDYASDLLGHSSHWQVGILYLDHCGPSGIAMAQLALHKITLTDDSRARKVIHMASDRNFDAVVDSVCKVMGRRALSQNRLGAAIWWGVRSRDSSFTSHVAHQILHKYIAEGRFESAPLLDQLGPAMLLSDTLTFLGKYREFHTMYQDGNFKNAASLLVSLISSKLAPEYFWPILLLDALPLLNSEEPFISSEETYELMYCMHNLSQSSSKSTKQSPMETEAAKVSFLEKEKEIRLSLSNNLARALMHEGTVED